MFLDLPVQSTLTMSTIRGWASAACDQHLSDGTDPTASLIKIAKDASLTPPQIEVLATEINKAIHMKKFALEEDKYHAANFPLANSKEAIASVQLPASIEKVAAVMPDPITAQDSFDIYAAFGVKEEMIKQASETTSDLRKGLERAALEKRAAEDNYEMAKHAASLSELNYINTVRQYVLTNASNGTERLLKVAEAAHAAKCAGMLDKAAAPLSKLAYSLKEEGLAPEKQAEGLIDFLMNKTASVAPDYLVSEWLQARVVNGSHPLVITLKTYNDDVDRIHEEMSQFNRCQDRLKLYNQKIRSL